MKKTINAKIHGSGTDKYRWVSGLTADERREVKNGVSYYTVLPEHSSTHPKRSGYKIIYYKNGRYQHREPDIAELEEIKKNEKSV